MGKHLSLSGLGRRLATLRQTIVTTARYRLLLENAHDIVLFMRARDGRIIDANRAALAAYGYTREELLGKHIADLRAQETFPAIRTQMGQANTQGILFETLHQRKNGAVFPVEVNSVGVTFSRERILMSVIRDITTRKRAEQEREEASLKTAELYENSRKIGLTRDPHEVLRILVTNSVLRHCQHAYVGIFNRPWDNAAMPPAQMHIITDWNTHTVDPSPVGLNYDLDPYVISRLRAQNGPVLFAEVDADMAFAPSTRQALHEYGSRCLAVAPLFAGGACYGFLTFHWPEPHQISDADIQHIQGLVDQAAVAIHNTLLFEAEARARYEAERANELRLRFLAMITHELRTPLTSIKGFASTLLAEDVTWDAATQREFIQTIDEEAAKLAEMIDQILDLSRIETGTLRISPSIQAIDKIMVRTVERLKPTLGRHTLTLDMPPASELPHVLADPQRIEQVLANLVDNAVKYSPINTTIHLRVTTDGQQVCVCVRDQGRGISPQDREHIFEAFRRGSEKEVRVTKGAGLGLAICKGLIEAHGGRIWVEDGVQAGTTLCFNLPASRNAEVDADPGRANARAGQPAA
jgi:PAS domain S-box-containing protein